MKLTTNQIKKIIENFIFEQEDTSLENKEDKEDSDDTKKKKIFTLEKYIKDTSGREYKINFKKEGDVYQLFINDDHFNPKGINVVKKINNAFLAVAGTVLIQHEDDIDSVKKMIEVVKFIDTSLAGKTDIGVVDLIRKKINTSRLPFSLLDDLLSRNEV